MEKKYKFRKHVFERKKMGGKLYYVITNNKAELSGVKICKKLFQFMRYEIKKIQIHKIQESLNLIAE